MNNFFSLLLIMGLFFSNQTRYWSLGVSINNQPKKKIIQKEINLDNFIVEAPRHTHSPHKNVYTLKTNYFIAPKSIDTENFEIKENFKNQNVTDLILEEEYFEAAKRILYLEKNGFILEEFHNLNDFYYWSSFVYYNLGNYGAALENICQVSNKENTPETLFLEALIIRDSGNKTDSNFILDRIIKEFSENDYAGYAKDILNDE